MSSDVPTPLLSSIGATALDTGISKETLRMWERRYGFPVPGRDGAGDRVYPADQIERLRHIKRAIDLGHRPAQLMTMAPADLLALAPRAAARAPARTARTAPATLDPSWLSRLRAADDVRLRRDLRHELDTRGLGRFTTEFVAPLLVALGDAWASGQIEVRHEHRCSELLTAVLRHAIGRCPDPDTGAPHVVLATLPGELHGLSLLMLEALLVVQGAQCASLGTQLPVAQIAAAAAERQAALVCVSASAYAADRGLLPALADLRSQLPRRTHLWAGGSARALRRCAIDGVEVFTSLEQAADAFSAMRRAMRSRTPRR